MNKITLIILCSILILGSAAVFLAKSNCSKGKCSPNTTTTGNLKTAACSSCGKSSCDKNCTDGNNASGLKASLPSCNLTDGQMQERKTFLKGNIFKKVKSIEEIETGFQLTFNEPPEFSKDLLEFINFERGCCASFSYALVFDADNKGTHLQLYGSKEIKDELRKGLTELGAFKSNKS